AGEEVKEAEVIWWKTVQQQCFSEDLKTLKEQVPKEDVLNTLFAEAEYIVNNRPLTHVSVDPNVPVCLTPNHFLLHRVGARNIPGAFSDGNFNPRCQWKLVQQLTEKL